MKNVLVFVIVVCGLAAFPLSDTDEGIIIFEEETLSTTTSLDVERSTYTTENGYEKNEEDLFTSKPVHTQPNINSLNNRDKINKFTQNNKNNKGIEADNNASQIDIAINNNDTDLSKKSGELEFPDRIGTPAIISLQGPPGK
ncbi:hypothetical protein RN001_008590 [Aquatica leii]|uniref:Uncharacterized protein n=1 Tax=Aquatica leii TaxID=1421715 RepID=A0AAN7PXI1_9COLE|nr:hypothetical protein RN001_008590 [Aquatica leii]